MFTIHVFHVCSIQQSIVTPTNMRFEAGTNGQREVWINGLDRFYVSLIVWKYAFIRDSTKSFSNLPIMLTNNDMPKLENVWGTSFEEGVFLFCIFFFSFSLLKSLNLHKKLASHTQTWFNFSSCNHFSSFNSDEYAHVFVGFYVFCGGCIPVL